MSTTMMNEVIDDQVGSAETYTYEYALANWEQLDINTVRHPLLSSWTFWFNNLKNEVDWVDSLKQVHGFGTIEDFWCLYNNIKTVEELLPLTSRFEFSLFRKGIEPMTEYPANRKGGRIMVIMEKLNTCDLDTIWLNSMLFLIGENFDNSEEFNGVVLAVRGRNVKLGFWTRCRNNDKIGELINDIKKCLPSLNSMPIQFQEHKTY